MLQTAFIRNFKGADTLLLWGDNSDVAALRQSLLAMHNGKLPSFSIVGGPRLTGITLQITPGAGVSQMTGTESDVVWLCSPDRFVELLTSLETLGKVDNGHQNIDVQGGLGSQVLISVNEYPESLFR